MNEEIVNKLKINDVNLTYFKFITGENKLLSNKGKINENNSFI